MPKKIYRMNLQEFKKLMLMALNEGIEELSSTGGLNEESLDEGVPPLTPQQRKRFDELKSKKISSSLSPEEKRGYLSLLQKDVSAKSDAGKQRTDTTFGQIDKLAASKPSSAAKAISEGSKSTKKLKK